MADTLVANGPQTRASWWKWWVLYPILLAVLAAAILILKWPTSTNAAIQKDENAAEGPSRIPVDVIKPTRGPLERLTVQPGNAIAYQTVEVIPEVAGYIGEQPVDIGSVVKKGDLLVKIRVPDLKTLMHKQEANLALTKSQVEEAKAAWITAKADLTATIEKIAEAEARLKAAQAALVFRGKQRKRYQELLELKGIDARLVDEQEDRYEAARESAIAAEAVLRSTKAQKEASEARVAQAKAALTAAERKVGVAAGECEYAQAMVNFATIRAPFAGVVTKRNFFPDDFVQAATGAKAVPLLTVQQTDKVRVVVAVPDRDVPYCDAGDEAFVTFDALPTRKYKAVVSRVAGSEDRLSKTMRVEIDLDNKDGRIRQGMYGQATIILAKIPNALSIPTTALVDKTGGDKATIYVVQDGKAVRTTVRTGMDNGLKVEVVDGLTDNDVVVHHPNGLENGASVEAVHAASTRPAHH